MGEELKKGCVAGCSAALGAVACNWWQANDGPVLPGEDRPVGKAQSSRLNAGVVTYPMACLPRSSVN